MNESAYLPGSMARDLIVPAGLCPEHYVSYDLQAGCPIHLTEQSDLEMKRWKEARKIKLREKLRLWDSAA